MRNLNLQLFPNGTWYIFNIVDGGPPNVSFPSRYEAEGQAERLAHKNPNKKFVVLQAVTCYESYTQTRVDILDMKT